MDAAHTDNSPPVGSVPLCVNLDGTLLRSSTLGEGLLILLQKSLFNIFSVLRWLTQGQARLRAEIAARVDLDAPLLPENQPFVAWLRQQHAAGRRLILCTEAEHRLADAVAAHFGIFERVIVSNQPGRCEGSTMAPRLLAEFGKTGYDYAAGAGDMPVWGSARHAIVVVPAGGVEAWMSGLPHVERVFPADPGNLREWLRGLRLHQWSKNVLILLPAAAAHQLLSLPVAIENMKAIIAFGLCASGTYVLNDLTDLDSDRRHPVKRARPFAAGRLSIAQGLLATVILIGAGLLLAALTMDRLFLLTLVSYIVITVWYTKRLKRIPMVDVLALAGLYAMRVLAGAAATHIVPSFWLLAFTMFLFLSLATAKRYSELKLMMSAGRVQSAGRGYTVDDAPLLQSCGVAAGYIGVLVIALYINGGTSAGQYRHPESLWLICPLLLYWVTRVWIKTSRGQMPHDPVEFALRDRPSLGVAGLALVLVFLAT